jgi:hypothetical protein
MAFITVPQTSITKGERYYFYVDKSELVLVDKVANDTYFSNSNVWKYFTLKYQSTNSGQTESILFDATIPSPEGSFIISDKSIGTFKVVEFIIHDFDGGKLILSSGLDLNTSEFALDIPLKIAPAEMVLSVASQHEMTLNDATYYEVDDYVILFNTATNSFESDERRRIINKDGDVVSLDSDFTTTITTNHALRIPNINECSANQVINFYFNS